MYEVYASLFQTVFVFIISILILFTSAKFLAYLTLGERTLGSIEQEASSQRDTRRKISGGGKGY